MPIDWDHLQTQYTTRLIPNPRGAPEARATAALMSMVRGVSEFGARFVKRSAGPNYSEMRRYIQCFTEVPFVELTGDDKQTKLVIQEKTLPKNKRHYARPDGLVRVQKSKREWKALVEVKVGDTKLEDDPDQITEYHRQASNMGFDALITISNEPALPGGKVPRGIESAIDGRRARRCPVFHIQWRELLGDAQALVDEDLEENVEDADQAWMLTEWIRYVIDDTSGILIQPTLGQHWTKVLELAGQSRLSAKSDELRDAMVHWVGYFGEIGYHLRMLGIRVVPKISKREKTDPDVLTRRLCDICVKEGGLIAEWKVPAPIETIRCLLHMGHGKIHYSFDLTSFAGKSSAGRVMEWIGQLDRTRAPEDLRLTVSWKGSRTKTSFLLRDIEGVIPLQKQLQAQEIDRSAWPNRLRFEWVVPLPRKRGQQGAYHLEAVTAGMVRFYEDVAAGIRSVERMPRPQRSKAVIPDDSDQQPDSPIVEVISEPTTLNLASSECLP